MRAGLVCAIDDAQDAVVSPDRGAVDKTGGVAEVNEVGAVDFTGVGALAGLRWPVIVICRLVEVDRGAHCRSGIKASGGDGVGLDLYVIVPLDVGKLGAQIALTGDDELTLAVYWRIVFSVETGWVVQVCTVVREVGTVGAWVIEADVAVTNQVTLGN